MTALSCSTPFLRPIEIVGGSQGRQIERKRADVAHALTI